MYILRRFHKSRFERFNAVIEALHGSLTDNINLIGSATLPLPEVCEAMALPASAVRVEGYLNSRLFPGTRPIDMAESLAEKAVAEVFGLDGEYSINVQPHSATQANHVVWKSFLASGSRVMGLSLNDGGHISHVLGLPEGVEFYSFPFNNMGIDYDELELLAVRLQPTLLIAGGSSYPLQIDYERLGQIAKKINAQLHADLAHTAAYIAGGTHLACTPYADTITIDTSKNLRGPKGGVLVFKNEHSKKIRRCLFPLVQSSPDQFAVLAKSLLFEYWSSVGLYEYSNQLMKDAQIFLNRLKAKKLDSVFEETHSHIVLINVSNLGLTGFEAEQRLECAKILVNRNVVPGETQPHWIGSGLRFGTSVLTIRGYSKRDIETLADSVVEVLQGKTDARINIERLIMSYHNSCSELTVELNSANELKE